MEAKRKRAAIRRILFLILTVALVVLLAVLPMLTAKQEVQTHTASILSGTAVRMPLQRMLCGGGPLAAPEQSEVTVPSGVKVTELIAANGDVLQKGDAIARVDRVSVMTAVTGIQQTLSQLESELQSLVGKLAPGAITVDGEGNIFSGGKKVANSDLSDYADYLTLSQQHREYEEMLLELFLMYQNGTVNAPCSGMIDGLNSAIVEKLSFGTGAKLSLLAVHVPGAEDPEADDEVSYTGYAGVVNRVNDDGSWDMLMSSTPYSVTDFSALGVTTDVSTMTLTGSHSAVTVFAFTGEEWTETGVASGDILLFTYADGSEAFVVKTGTAQIPGSKPEQEFPGGMGGAGQNGHGTVTIPEGLDISGIMGSLGGRGGYGGASGGGTKQEDSRYSTQETLLCTVIPQETMTLTISVDEQDIAQVQPGMTAAVTMDALPEEAFTAVVTKVSKFGSSNGGSSKFEVELELPYQEGMLPGMNGAAALVMETVEDAVIVPVAALVEQGSQTVVYTGYDEKTETLVNPVPVKTGLSDGENVQILSGLAQGEQYWYSYYDVVEISTAVETRGMFG